MVSSQAPPSRRRLWASIFVAFYVIIALPVWYRSVRLPRAPLPLPLLEQLEAATAAAAPPGGRTGAAVLLPVTVTAYVVCPASSPGGCPAPSELPLLAELLGAAVLREAGLGGPGREQVPLHVRVMLDAPGRCSASSWSAPSREAADAAGGAGGGEGGGPQAAGSQRQRQQPATQQPPQPPQQARLAGGGVGCLDLAAPASAAALRVVMGAEAREFDDWAAGQLAGQDRPGNYHLFISPDPWMSPNGLPYGVMGRRRTALVRHPSGLKATHGSVIRLAALLAAPAFASYLGGSLPFGGPGSSDGSSTPPPPPLPLNPAAQLHLSFSLCNAHPAPTSQHDSTAPDVASKAAPAAAAASGSRSGERGGGAAAAAAFVWSFATFEAQYIAPVKQLLSPAARLTVSSQVLYFTPGRVNATWDEHRLSFVLPYHQLPSFIDSAWPLDPGRTGLPASAAGGGEVPYDVAAAATPAGSRVISIGEAMVLLTPPLQARVGGRGGGGAAAAAAAAAAALPYLLPPSAAESLPPSVLHFVLYAPQPWQRPLLLLGPEGERAPANSLWVPGWGMLQVLNQVPPADALVAPVGQQAMEEFAVEFLTQLRSLLGLAAARSRLLALGNTAAAAAGSSSSSGDKTAISATNRDNNNNDNSNSSSNNNSSTSSSHSEAVGPVTLLSALRTGLAPWEVDALVRRRVAEDVRAAGATLGSLARLLRQMPTLAVPQHVGSRVRGAAAALQRAMRLAAEGRYQETSRAAQEARAWSEAAFSDPSLSPRLNVPDTHAVGVYLPFCLPAAVPILQALSSELRKWWRERGKGSGRGKGAG
ncbi:hypothetical protein Agub_g9883, partial [Astrephomene gubernaculifera]